MSKTEKRTIRVHWNRDGTEVRVYQEFDKDSAKPVGKPTFMHLHEEGAEEVAMVPAEFDIDDFRERQDMWLLYPPDALEYQLNSKMPIYTDDALLPKEWLTTDNWKLYLQQMIEMIEDWKKNNGPLEMDSAKTLQCLKAEYSEQETPLKDLCDSSSRTPHGAYASHAKAKGVKRNEAWKQLKQLAMKCSSESKNVELPGFGLIFLKLDRQNPKTKLWYHLRAFEGPDDLRNSITQKAFERAWDRA